LGSDKCGQFGADRVSFRVRNTDAPELKEGRDGIVTPEYHLRNGYEARHNVGFGLVQLRRNDPGRACHEVISLFFRDIAIGLD
jgi:hypothetical protein